MRKVQEAVFINVIERWKSAAALIGIILALTSCATKPQIGAVVINNRLASTGIEIQRNGSISEAAPGTELEKGDVILTGPGEEAVLILENGKVEVTLFENTQVTFSSLILAIGDIVVKIKGRLKETFQVESEFGIAASESTIYYVSVKKDATDLTVVGIEGAVRYYPPDNSRSVLLQPRDRVAWNNRNLSESTIDRDRYNALLKRVNDVERAYKRGSATLVVPNVIGRQINGAEKFLRSEGFRLGEPLPVLSDQTLGTVVATKPPPGRLSSQKTAIVISFAAKATVMPDVIGLFEQQARSALAKANVKLGDTDSRITGKSQPGKVISQSVVRGERVAAGSKVKIVLEAESIKVPNVEGMGRDSAVRALERDGFRVGKIDTEYVVNVRGDVVTYQSLTAGKLVTPKSRVDLVVEERGVEVPSLEGKTLRDALKLLRGKDIQYGYYPKSDGKIVEQSIRPYEVVEPGSFLDLVVEPYVVE